MASISAYFYATRVKIVSANDSYLSRFDFAIGRNMSQIDH